MSETSVYLVLSLPVVLMVPVWYCLRNVQQLKTRIYWMKDSGTLGGGNE